MTNSGSVLCAGLDFRRELPAVCYQTAQMRDIQVMPLDFSECTGRTACFRKILSGLKKYGKKEDIRAVLVLPDMEEETISHYLAAAKEAGFSKEQLKVASETQSVIHLIMHQEESIWQQQVWLLEFGVDEVRALGFQVNKRTKPMLVQALAPEYWYIGTLAEGNRDEKLLEAVREHFRGKKISAVFVAGTDLAIKDYKKSREALCDRRRVFLAEQIYARGACTLAGDKGESGKYLFLNEQTLLYNTGIRSVRAGEESVHTLIGAGCSWYEAKGSCEVILFGDAVLEFSFQSMMGGEPLSEGMVLTDLPQRPPGTSRLLVEACFTGPAQCEVKATDLGFGELYPATDLYWKETFMLKEDEHGTGDDLQP